MFIFERANKKSRKTQSYIATSKEEDDKILNAYAASYPKMTGQNRKVYFQFMRKFAHMGWNLTPDQYTWIAENTNLNLKLEDEMQIMPDARSKMRQYQGDKPQTRMATLQRLCPELADEFGELPEGSAIAVAISTPDKEVRELLRDLVTRVSHIEDVLKVK